MRKRICGLLLCMLCTAVLTGCEKEKETDSEAAENPTVELVVWGAEEDTELMNQIIQSFQTKYQGEAEFQISFQVQGESQCKDALIGGLEDGADVFTFADDQLNALAAAGALDPIENAEEIIGRNLSSAVEAATINERLYAYPLTADNGYFLFYNKQYITEEQAKTLDGILEAAAEEGKLFTMDWTSAWYVYSFFGNTGLQVGLNDDGITNYCTWNQTGGDIQGTDVAQAMLRIAANPGFASRTDEEFLNGVKDGSVIAGVSGVWNAVAIKEAWGENAGAAKLPTYSCKDSQVQMASFSGCKLIGVNAYSEYPEWASRLAEWITNEENQRLRFEMREQGPSNIAVADSAEIQQSPAIAALLEQSEFSQLQRVGGKFWDPVSKFAANMAAGNPSGQDLQEQLDEMAEGISAR
ncbi:extracellular solute-binding protein [Petralouisia muris]|mgnify:CR=1 FL=1|jgi:arabinogalactan oligomer/maltooligosaccharide transport system substrate-binding protein|uniref:Extracellular solute-binding protein n=1 Tax=Petralouisia muris TaxID=3032872 RepID=A0AC61S063_9FIRM|nr:extracellular solute-binding protein [Petralouisia muris]TGY97838.1 extracellular solute-binding protein [Petralouisia muris]